MSGLAPTLDADRFALDPHARGARAYLLRRPAWPAGGVSHPCEVHGRDREPGRLIVLAPGLGEITTALASDVTARPSWYSHLADEWPEHRDWLEERGPLLLRTHPRYRERIRRLAQQEAQLSLLRTKPNRRRRRATKPPAAQPRQQQRRPEPPEPDPDQLDFAAFAA